MKWISRFRLFKKIPTRVLIVGDLNALAIIVGKINMLGN